jgi:hypothetical protein
MREVSSGVSGHFSGSFDDAPPYPAMRRFLVPAIHSFPP